MTRCFFAVIVEAKLRSKQALKKARMQLIMTKKYMIGHSIIVSEYIWLDPMDLSMPLHILP
jgi:hypothetical protein